MDSYASPFIYPASPNVRRKLPIELIYLQYQSDGWSVIHQRVDSRGGFGYGVRVENQSERKPRSRAIATAWVRLCTPNLPYRLLRWVLTVLTAMTSCSAISWLLKPAWMRRRT